MVDVTKKRFSIDATTWKKVGVGFLIAIAGGVLSYLETLATGVDLGAIGIIAQFAVNAGLINLARKFLSEYKK